jgi:hypothetical protein
MPAVTKLIDIGQIFTGTGATWYRPQRTAWSGDLIHIDQYAASGSYNSSGPNAVNLVLQGEDRFGEVSNYAVPIASYTTGMNVNNVEVADKGVALLSSPIQGLVNGAAFWVTPTVGSPGSFDIKFRTFSFQPSAISRDTGFPDTYNLGAEMTLKTGIADYNSFDFDWITPVSGPILVLGYTTRAAGAATQDVYYQAFDGQGQALGPGTQVASGVRPGSFTMTDNGTDFFFAKEVVSGGVASIEVRSFAPTTGALGPATTIATNFASLFSIGSQPQADGTFDIVVDGVTAGNQRFLAVYQASASFTVAAAPVTIALASANGVRFNTQRMANDSMVLAYTDAGQVHLAVFDGAGTLLDNSIVPGITNFDRIRSIGQNQFELVWRETVSGNENVVKGAIYDANTSGRVVDQSGATTSVWQLGSHFNDTLKGGSANDIFKGYGGNDTILGGSGQDMVKYTGNKADYTLVRNGDGSWTVTDTRGGAPDGVDTLWSVETADFADGQKQLISAQATELTKLGPIFLNGASAPITGVVWGRPHRGVWNGDVVFIDNYASASGYVSGGPNAQTLVVAGQDKFGDLDKAVIVANYTSGKTVNNVEVLDKGVILNSQASASGPAAGFAFWVAPTVGGLAGTFDVKLQALNFAAGQLAYNTGNPSVTLVGSPTTLFAGVANYYSVDWNTASDGTTVVGYATRAAGASTMDWWYTKVDSATGMAAYAPQKVATTSGLAVISVSGTVFTIISEDQSSGSAKLKFQGFDADTGAVGPVLGLVDPGNLADIYSSTDFVLSDGSRLFVVEGLQLGTGAHVLQTFTVNSLNIPTGTPTTTMLTAGQTLSRIQHQLLGNGLSVVGYTDNSQVHLSLFDQFGNLVSDTIVPGLTNFDRLRNLGQNQVEFIWRETVSGAENVVKAAIFDGNDVGRFVNLSGSTSAQWLLGSHFVDVMTGGSANDIFKGYAGNDSINGGAGFDEADYTGARANYSIVRNPDGSYTVTDNRSGSPDGTDTLTGIELLQFSDGVMRIGAAVPKDINGDGKSDILFHAASGAELAWQMSDTVISAGGTIGNAGALWTQVASGDFNGDGKADILFRKADGTLSTWTLSGTTISGGATIGNPGNGWSIAGTGDFDGNGTSDILFRGDNGSYATWRLSGGALIGGATLGNPGAGWVFRATGDFNGDGKTDVLFQNATSGAYATWLVNGDALAGGATLGNPGASWVFRTIGDFNGDGTSDILFQNVSNGAYASWNVVNDAIQGGGTIGTPGTAWTLRDVGDYNGDGKTDLLFQNRNGTLSTWDLNNTSIIGGGNIGNPGLGNTVSGAVKTAQPLAPTILFQKSDGTVASWGMTGTTISSGATFGSSGSAWTAVAKADFNGDGKLDMLFRDASGNLATWQTNGAAIIAGGGTIGNPGSGFAYKGVGDFDGDGRTDILFQNSTTGSYVTWDIAGISIVGGGTIGNPGGTWSQVGIGDFDGDGRSDLLFKDASGKLATWNVGDTTIVGGGSLGSPGSDWTYVGLGDFNGDRKSDLLFQKTDGTLATWNLSGTSVIGGGTIGNAGPNWVFQGIQDLNGDGKSDILFHSAGGTNLSAWLMNDTAIVGGGSVGDPGSSWRVVG